MVPNMYLYRSKLQTYGLPPSPHPLLDKHVNNNILQNELWEQFLPKRFRSGKMF
jgi:hypothetical protein